MEMTQRCGDTVEKVMLLIRARDIDLAHKRQSALPDRALQANSVPYASAVF
jgi:Flp pilus assembly protein protease CpaA